MDVDSGALISIVDDDALVRDALCRLCASMGYQSAAFESAEDFLDASPAADCLILDVHLPGQSGVQLQSKFEQDENTTPIIFMTAFDDKDTETLTLQRGAVAFLRKPLDTSELMRYVDQVLQDRDEQ